MNEENRKRRMRKSFTITSSKLIKRDKKQIKQHILSVYSPIVESVSTGGVVSVCIDRVNNVGVKLFNKQAYTKVNHRKLIKTRCVKIFVAGGDIIDAKVTESNKTSHLSIK